MFSLHLPRSVELCSNGSTGRWRNLCVKYYMEEFLCREEKRLEACNEYHELSYEVFIVLEKGLILIFFRAQQETGEIWLHNVTISFLY